MEKESTRIHNQILKLTFKTHLYPQSHVINAKIAHEKSLTHVTW